MPTSGVVLLTVMCIVLGEGQAEALTVWGVEERRRRLVSKAQFLLAVLRSSL